MARISVSKMADVEIEGMSNAKVNIVLEVDSNDDPKAVRATQQKIGDWVDMALPQLGKLK